MLWDCETIALSASTPNATGMTVSGEERWEDEAGTAGSETTSKHLQTCLIFNQRDRATAWNDPPVMWGSASEGWVTATVPTQAVWWEEQGGDEGEGGVQVSN